MVIMALVYIFGILSGVLLVAMIMATWVHNAARRLREQSRANTGEPPVARHRSHRHRGHHQFATSTT